MRAACACLMLLTSASSACSRPEPSPDPGRPLGASTEAPPATPPEAASVPAFQGRAGLLEAQPCGGGKTCPAPMTCITYYGIAGRGGPRHDYCFIRCHNDADCPKDQTCVTIADGPGSVCQPRRN